MSLEWVAKQQRVEAINSVFPAPSGIDLDFLKFA